MNEVLYYESHITTVPVDGTLLDDFKCISKRFGFKVATLLFSKTATSNIDSFTMGKSDDYHDLLKKQNELVYELIAYGIKVKRAKIEAVIYDKRYME